MYNFNSNDYKILECVVDKDKNRGLSLGRGSTLKQIVDKTGLSIVKVRNTIKILLQKGYVIEGVKKERAKSYCITEEGIKKIRELKKNII